MKQDVQTVPAKKISPFEIKQAVIGMEMKDRDEKLLSYLNFLTQRIPTFASYFIHVLPDFSFASFMADKSSTSMLSEYALNEEMVNVMEQRVKQTLLFKDKIYVEYNIREGDPLEELLKTTADTQADLVVVGQKAETGRHGVLARNVARNTSSNALVIPENARNSLSKMLVPLDYSEHSSKALETAMAINKQLKEKAEIVCLHIYTMPNVAYFKIDRPWQEYKRIVTANIREGFNAFISEYEAEDRANISFDLIQRDLPGIANYIYDYAQNYGTDLIIMGAKGHSRIERLLMGSTTEKLMSLNEFYPTLIVR